MKFREIASLVLLTIVIAVAGYGIVLTLRGFSARGTPSSVERLAAKTVRALALPSGYNRLRNPYPPAAGNIRAGMERFASQNLGETHRH